MDQAEFECAVGDLVARDTDLAALVELHGTPTVWVRPPGFPALVLLVLEQQVSLASGAAAYRRVGARVGPMTPEGVLSTTAAQLREDGVSRQKDRYLRALADAVVSGALDLASLEAADDDTVRRHLTALPGIGQWTADSYLLACLGRPDVWPVGDRALQVAVGETLHLGSTPGPVDLERFGERWRPLRASAARLLWHGYLRRRGRTETATDVLR